MAYIYYYLLSNYLPWPVDASDLWLWLRVIITMASIYNISYLSTSYIRTDEFGTLKFGIGWKTKNSSYHCALFFCYTVEIKLDYLYQPWLRFTIIDFVGKITLNCAFSRGVPVSTMSCINFYIV